MRPPAKVLFVDDDPQLRELFAIALHEAGFVVVEEASAQAALAHIATIRPDVLVLDLGMPPDEMSGIEMLIQLREQPEFANLPVIVFSGIGDIVNPDVMEQLHVQRVVSKGTGDLFAMIQVVRDVLARAA